MHTRVVSMFLHVLDHRLLLHDNSIQVLEQLGQLDHGLLDLLDCVVALAHVGQGALGLAAAVGVHECLLEDLRVAAGFADFAQLGLGCVRVHDQVLPFLLLLDFVPEGGLLLLEVVDGFLDAAVEVADLWRVLREAGVWKEEISICAAGRERAM